MIDYVGQRFGNYQLLRLLGHGGFADVYLAQHIYLKTKAAIKILQTSLGKNDLQVFQKEARIIVNLIHTNIVRVLEFGVEKDIPFLVMDYAPNGTLRERLSGGARLSPAKLNNYVQQVAAALQYAHDKNVIHRDVKPENMLVGKNGEILLSDFGVAMASKNLHYQSKQEIGGTVAYAAPEQLQGKACSASDQYALGITVYEWLSGERPFKGSFFEIANQHLYTSPPPLCGRVPALSDDIALVVHRALEKNPEDRFSSVSAFAAALKQAIEKSKQPGSSSSKNVQAAQRPPTPAGANYFQPSFTPILDGSAQFPAAPQAPQQFQNMASFVNTPSPQQFQNMASFVNTPPPQQFQNAASFVNIPPPQQFQNMASFVNAPPLSPPPNKPTASSGNTKQPSRKKPTEQPGNTKQLSRKKPTEQPGNTKQPSSKKSTEQPGNTKQPSGKKWAKAPANNKQPSGRLRRKIVLLATAAFVILLAFNTMPSLVRFLQSFTRLPIGTADTSAATHALVKAGTLLYRANWSQGADDCNGSSQWNTPDNGQMGSSGTDTRSFTTWSAIQLPTTNYAVAAKIRFVRSTYPDAYYRHYEFGIVVRGDGNGNGYEVGMVDSPYYNVQRQGALIALINNDNNDNSKAGFSNANGVLQNAAYKLVPNAWHTYRVEVKANDIKFYLDGTQLAKTSDNTYLSGTRVGLRAVDADVDVSDFSVTAL